MAGKLKDLCTNDLMRWVDTVLNEDDKQIFSTEARRKDMKMALMSNDVTGAELIGCKNISDVREMIQSWKGGNYSYLKKQVWEAIKTQREIDNNNNNHNNNNNNDDVNEADEMAQLLASVEAQRMSRSDLDYVNVCNNNDEGKDSSDVGTITIKVNNKGNVDSLHGVRFKPSDTVGYLRQRIHELTGILLVDNKGKKLGLLFRGTKIDGNEEATLQSLGFKENCDYNPEINIYYYVNGGAIAMKQNKEEIVLTMDAKWDKRERLPDFQSKTGIKPSLKPDCIMGYDSKKELRIEMPCGHVFSSKTIFRLAKMYANDLLADGIVCPMEKCDNRFWDFSAIAAGGDFSKKESNFFQHIFEKRAILRSGNIKECGGCGSYVSLPDELGRIRVHCTHSKCKKRSDFCWTCGNDWKGGGFSFCGNKDCPNMGINDTLAKCESIKPKYLNGMECPALRSCPRCLQIVQWNEECKHVTCWACKTTFCFICLSVKGFIFWPSTCGSYTTQCKLAKRQQLKG